VIETNHEKNEITVRFANGRKLIYDPKRLSGVSVYSEAERAFAAGDRVQIRAPNRAKRIANGELGTITRIEGERLHLTLDDRREISLDLRQFRHFDHGYAVTSYTSQGLTFDRVLVNVDTRQSAQLVNDRLAYVAISRARHDAQIYTDSTQNLRDVLNRGTNKESAIDATRDSLLDLRKELDKLRRDPLAPQQQPSTEHRLTQPPTPTAPAPTKAAELEIEGPEIDLGDLIL
jgi:ATP-dependent exoDNAse (exonuclease V) alpha subunit